MIDTQTIVERCLSERREKAVEALLRALQDIASDGPAKKPRPQAGSDRDPLLAYEDGYADASYSAAEAARLAIEAWEAFSA